MPRTIEPAPYKQKMAEAEADIMRSVLAETEGNRFRASLALGMHPVTFYRKCKAYGI